jgi:hypothetical protein
MQANNFITMLLGIFPHEIGKKRTFFTLGLGPILAPKTVGKSLDSEIHIFIITTIGNLQIFHCNETLNYNCILTKTL